MGGVYGICYALGGFLQNAAVVSIISKILKRIDQRNTPSATVLFQTKVSALCKCVRSVLC